MKKLLVTVLAVIMLISLTVSISATGITARVEHISVWRGDTVTLTVTLLESTELKRGSVSISYNDEALELVGGRWFDTGEFNLATNGGSFSLSEATSIGGDIFSAKFKIKDDAQFDTYDVSMTLALYDATDNQIALRNEPGSITVKCKQEYTQEVAEDVYLASKATCTEKAVYYKSCSCCGAKGTETFTSGDPLGHTGGTATCTKQALCERCNQYYGELAPHEYKQQVTTEYYLKTAATCTTQAVYYYSCTCGATGTETFEDGGTVPHVYDQQVIADEYLKSAATCTQKALYYYSCTCGKRGTETFEYGELAHTYDQQVTTETYLQSAATCTEKAVYYYSCTCGAKGNETFEHGELLAHTYDQQVTTNAYLKSVATCAEKAVYYYSCTCGAKGTETFEDGGTVPHVYDQQVIADEYLKSEATCTEKAVYYYSCACGAKGEETFEYGEMLDHTYDHPVAAFYCLKAAATCTERAVYYYSCTCGAIGTETFTSGAPLGHTGGTATCTAKAVCTRCDQSYGEKLPHTYDQKVTGEAYKKSDADCVNAAVYYKSCTCGAIGTETFTVGSALGHTGGTATCTAMAVCTRCDQPYGEMLPHNYDQEVVSKAHKKSDADCLNAAVYYYSCTCGANGTETFTVGAALGHTEVSDTAVEATCTTPGLTEGKHCSTCGEILAAQEKVAALGHAFSDWNPNKSATCTEPGEDTRTCSACGQTETREISANGHTWTDATCTKPKTCTACGKTEGEPLDHSFSEWSDSEKAGEQERTCSTCGQTETTVCCIICGRDNICISIIPLCWLCLLLLLLLIVLAVMIVVCWIVLKKRKKDAEEQPEEEQPEGQSEEQDAYPDEEL